MENLAKSGFAGLLFLLAVSELNAEEECGTEVSNNPIHRDPWLVLLTFHRRGFLTEFKCGGSLISSWYVVTAAHCLKAVKNHRMIVLLGEFDAYSKLDCFDGICADQVVKRQVDKFIVHPDYDGKTNDIALLKLSEEVPYTDFIRPICLPSGEINEGTIFHASGFGEDIQTGTYSGVKKSISLPYWSSANCQNAYKRDVIPHNTICAGGRKNVDTCRGDSGGPLVWYRYKAELWGVTSSGPVHCGKEGSPGIYTSVMVYINWITFVIEDS